MNILYMTHLRHKMLVFTKLKSLDESASIARDLGVNTVIPYWYPDDVSLTFESAALLRATVPRVVSVGIVALGKGNNLMKFISRAISTLPFQFAPIVLSQANLGTNLEKGLADLEAEGLFRTFHWYHIAGPIDWIRSDTPSGIFTFGADFVDMRNEEEDAQ